MNKHLRNMTMAGALGVASLFASPGGAFAGLYTFTTITDPFNGTLSGNNTPLANGNTYVRGINDLGQIAGFADVNNGARGGWEGFIGSPSPNSRTFTYSPGSFTGINAPYCCQSGYSFTQVNGINNKGQIVGEALGQGPGTAFVYSGGSYTGINGINISGRPMPNAANGINGRGQIVGTASFGFGGYLDTNGTFTHINGEPYGINVWGDIVGGQGTGFLDMNGKYSPINDPLATNGTYARGINNIGQIVGYYKNASGTHGFIDQGGTFTTIAMTGASLTSVYGINNLGDIVGSYTNTSGTYGFLATPKTPQISGTPEPSTWILFGTGIALGMMGLRNRKDLRTKA